MAIPPGSLQTEFDFQNPACFTNGGTTITDLSGNGNNFTLNNTSYTYDATYGSLTLPNGTYADGTPSDYAFGTAAFSVLAWVKYNDLPGVNVFHFGGEGVGERTFFYWRNSDDFIVSDNAGAAGGWVQAPDNEWHLLAITRPSSSLCVGQNVYIDGVLVTNNPANFYNPSVPLNATSGAARIHSNVFGYTSDPLEIATFEVYTAQLSAGDILAYYNDTASRFAPVPVPIAQYDFQNGSYPGSGTSVLDLSGTGNTLAITSGGTWVSGTPNYFDLQGDTAIYKSPALGGIASTNVFTINGWYYLPTTVLNSVVLDVGKDIANQSAQIASGFGLGEIFASGGFGYGVLEYTGAAQPGWNFISYVSTGSSSTAYLNGASIGSTTNVPSLPSDAGIIIGTALNNSSPPVPRLDLAAVGRVGYFDVYNVALGSTQITDIYNATVSSYPPVPPPPSSNGVGGRQFAQGFNG